MAGRGRMPDTRRGYNPSEVVSALQKAIRRSQVREAMYWAMELYISGYDAWMWKRLRIILSEDIGPADRHLPATISALEENSKLEKKKGGGGMEALHAVILMASAPKSRLACWAVMVATGDNHPRFEIPDEALDQHTLRGKQMNRRLPHFMEEASKLVDPESVAASEGCIGVDEWLGSLEKEYEELFDRAAVQKDPTLPDNPKQKKEKPDNGVKTHDLSGPQGTLGE